MYVNQAVIIIATILVNFKVIAFLGPYQFGIYSTVLAYTSFFAMLTYSSGVDELAIKDLADISANKHARDVYFSTIFLIRIALGAVACCLSIIGSILLRYDRQIIILIAIFSLSMLFSFHRRNSLFLVYHIAREQRLGPELIMLVVTVSVLTLKFLLTSIGSRLDWFVISDLILIVGISASFCILALKKNYIRVKLNLFDSKLSVSLLKKAGSIALVAFFTMLAMRIDQVMLGKIKGMSAVGIYNLAVQLVEGFSFVPIIASSLLLPIFSRNIQNKKIMDVILSISFRTAAWASLLIVTVYWLAGETILRFIWGDQYIASLIPLKLLAWSEFFVFIGVINWAACISYGFQNYVLIITIITTALNILLNILLIPTHGVAGAAISTCISYGTGIIFMWTFPELRNLATIICKQSLPLAAIVFLLICIGQNYFNLKSSVAIISLGLISAVLLIMNIKQGRYINVNQSRNH
jgi:O-antigen/teichoic acid export membrane protein